MADHFHAYFYENMFSSMFITGRPPEGGRLDIKVVSGYAFLRTYYVYKKKYLISIDARLRSRNSTFSVEAETAKCLVARDSIIA